MATRSRRSQKYWAERKARELYENLIPVEEAAEDLRRLYFQASKEIEKEAADIAKRFQLKNNLTEEEAERLLNLVVDPKDIRRMTRELRKDPTNQELIAQLEAPAYAARINRLAKVQDNVNTVVANLLAPVQDTFDSVLRTIAETSFYQSLFGLQERTGVKFPVIALNERRVTEILNRRWSGKNFSERLWSNSERLSSSVKRELMLGVLTGKTRRQMTQAIQEEFSSASYVTRRLIRTEACYVAGQMDLETYRQNGITEYEYVAILDHRTSEICRELDGQRFPVEEAEVGVNYPPMHPWCRSSTVPAIPKKLEDKIVVQYYDAEGNTVRETLTESKAARQAAPQFAMDGGRGLDYYTTEELEQMNREAYDIVNDYIDNESKHTGIINIFPDDSKYVAQKEWDCSISLRHESSMHMIIHENIHAHSASYFDSETYKKWRSWEEGPVELLAQEISKQKGFDITGSETYKTWVQLLRDINKKASLYETDLDFAKALIEVPLTGRRQWLYDLVGIEL